MQGRWKEIYPERFQFTNFNILRNKKTKASTVLNVRARPQGGGEFSQHILNQEGVELANQAEINRELQIDCCP